MNGLSNVWGMVKPLFSGKIDKTFLIAEPMGKVSWTKCFAAGGGSVGGGLE